MMLVIAKLIILKKKNWVAKHLVFLRTGDLQHYLFGQIWWSQIFAFNIFLITKVNNVSSKLYCEFNQEDAKHLAHKWHNIPSFPYVHL